MVVLMLNMMVMSDFWFEASITSKKKDFPRLESNMAHDNVEGDMEVETKIQLHLLIPMK